MTGMTLSKQTSTSIPHTANPGSVVPALEMGVPMIPCVPHSPSASPAETEKSSGYWSPVESNSDNKNTSNNCGAEKPTLASPKRPETRCSPLPAKSLRTWFNPTLTLENHGSTARDHLAAERTFLAYVRTSLAIAAAGVALVQLLVLAGGSLHTTTGKGIQAFAKPLGVVSVSLALVLLNIGVYRFFLVQNKLIEGQFPAARVSVAFTTFALGAIVLVVFGVLAGVRS